MVKNNIIRCGFVFISLLSLSCVAQRMSEATLRKMKPSHIQRLLNDARRLNNQALVKQLEDYLAQITPTTPPIQPMAEGNWYWLPTGAGEGQWVWISRERGIPVVGPTTPGVQAPVFIEGSPTIMQPAAPPEGAVGPGQWRWFSQPEGEGQWGWIPEKGEIVIGGPATSPEAQIIAPPEELPEIVQPALPQPTEVPTPPAGGPSVPPSGAPPIPGGVQPPAGPSLEEQLAAKRRAESTAARVLQPLDAAALAALTQQEKDASDKLIYEALKKIAHEVFIKPENVAKKTKVTVGVKQKELDTPFLAYQWFIKEVLIQDVGANNQFKKRQELIDLLGEEDAPGLLFQFINQVLKKGDTETLDQFLMRIKNNIDRYTTDMLALFEPGVFNVQSLRQQETDNVQTIVVNVAVTQRPGVKITTAIVRGTQKEISEPTTLQRALNQRAVENMFKKYIGELHRAADKIVSLQDPLVDDDDKFLLNVLRDELNMMRLNPEFYRFDVLTGSALRAIAKSLSGIERNQRLPLLDVLGVYDEEYIKDLISTMNIKAAIDGVLFFNKDEADKTLGRLINFQVREKPEDPQTIQDPIERQRAIREMEQWQAIKAQLGLSDNEIEAIIINNDLLKKAISDYGTIVSQQMRERKEALDPYDIINEQLQNVIQYKEIKEILRALKKVAGTPNRNKIIDAIIKELDHPQFAPNIDQIINLFKQLTNRQQLAFEQNLRKRINAFIAQNANVSKVLDILAKVIKSYKARTPSLPIGKELIQDLENEGIPIGRFKEQLKGVRRTAQSVYEALQSLSNRTALAAVMREAKFKETDFYKLIEPYGLLMMILDGWSKKAPGDTAEEKINALFNTLQLLNSQADMFKEGIQYAEGLVQAGSTDEKKLSDYKDLVYARMYADKLTQLINNLELFQFDVVKKEIQQLVAAGGTGAQNDPDFDTIVTEFQKTFAQLLFRKIIDQFTLLNKGETNIEGLPISRYVDLYVAMRGQLTSLLNILAPGGNPVTDLSTLNLPQINQELGTFENNMAAYLPTKAARDAFNTYLGRLKGILANLGQFVPAAVPAIPAVTGDGIPPVPAGGPPPVPAGGPKLPRSRN